MKIDTDHLHHWMNAVRISNNPMRTLDAFWAGQIKSKEWLIHNLDDHIKFQASIDIHGGWVGVLASMIFQSDIPVTNIRSIDIDPLCNHVAEEMNRIEVGQGRFRAVTGDMTTIHSDSDIIINTSCEHITQEQYDKWLKNIVTDQLLVLQSNNYNIPEHIRIAQSLDEFVYQSNLTTVLFAGELKLPTYTRYMIIGNK